MSAIKSGWLCTAEFCWIEDALAKPKFAKLGSVQPMRHARAAIQRDIPAATADPNVRCGKRITYSLYRSILQDNLF
jgi:hypothetical protein